jgi:hypothetical protein
LGGLLLLRLVLLGLSIHSPIVKSVNPSINTVCNSAPIGILVALAFVQDHHRIRRFLWVLSERTHINVFVILEGRTVLQNTFIRDDLTVMLSWLALSASLDIGGVVVAPCMHRGINRSAQGRTVLRILIILQVVIDLV